MRKIMEFLTLDELTFPVVNNGGVGNVIDHLSLNYKNKEQETLPECRS